jgi:dTDP-4-dehydrorhamnose reductase
LALNRARAIIYYYKIKKLVIMNRKIKKTVLIFGISSAVGSNLAEFLKYDYKVIGTFHNHRTTIPEVLCVPCDVLRKEEVQLIMYVFKPDIAIYTVGLSSVQDCAISPNLADSLNTAGLFNVAEYCQRYKAQIVYLSSSYVFGGANKNYIEMDIPDPNTVYGKTKASAEFYLQKNSLNYLIIRCCNFYCRSINPKQRTIFETLQDKMQKGDSFTCDDSVHNGYLDPYFLGMILHLCFDNKVMNRLFQLSSSDYGTFYDFIKTYAKVFSEPEGLFRKGKWLFPATISTMNSNVKGDLYYKLDTSNIESYLDVELPTIEESLSFTFERFHGIKNVGKNKSNDDAIKYI